MDALQSQQARIKELERDKDALLESYAEAAPEALENLTPEGRHEVYKMLRVRVFAQVDGTLEVRGAFRAGFDVCEKSTTVAWFTHYPAISFSEEVSSAGLVYGDNLEDLEEVARRLLAREAPTVVVNGHVHLRATRIEGPVLQVSCAALVEPPFEVTLLDLVKLGGGRVKVRRESTSLTVRSPAFSPPRQG